MFLSTRRLVAPVALLASVLAGCTDTVPDRVAGPVAVPDAHLAVVASPDDQYLVLARNSFRSDFRARVASLGGSVRFLHDGAGFAVVSGLSAASAAKLGASSDVDDVEADMEVTVAPTATAIRAFSGIGAQSQSAPASAALFAQQWNMLAIQADVAWANGKLGSSGVTVAILDSGLDYDNRDLVGLVDLSRSVSLVQSDNDYLTAHFPARNLIDDLNGHGTNVGATVSSKAFAFAGVTSRTTLIGVKVIGASGVGSLGTILTGVLFAADHGADVANLSLGGSFSKKGNHRVIQVINQVFMYASRQGVVIVASAGNESTDLKHDGNTFATFCDAPHVVCVSATGPTDAASVTGPWTDVDAFADYSNFGKNVITVAAPGGTTAGLVWSFCARLVLVTTPSGDTFPCAGGNFILGAAGTSQASPHVAGLAALLVSELGRGNPSLIVQVIKNSSDDLGKHGRDAFFGAGRINVARSLGL